jgi:hypothetical protein
MKSRVGFRLLIGFLKIQHERHQSFGDKAPAKHAEMAGIIGAFAEGIGIVLQHDTNS